MAKPVMKAKLSGSPKGIGPGSRNGSRRDDNDRVKCLVCGKWLQNINWKHLAMHGLTTDGYKERFDVSYLQCDELRRIHSEGNRRRRRKYRYRPLDKSAIVSELKRLAVIQSPLLISWVDKVAPGLDGQAIHAFGTWKKALHAIGQEPFQSWSKEKILREIRKRKKAGLSLADSDVHRSDVRLLSAARVYWGSWRKAIDAAGLDYNSILKLVYWSKTLSVELKSWCRKHGPLNSAKIRKDVRLEQAIVRKYGTVRAAAKALRLPYESKIVDYLEKSSRRAPAAERLTAGRRAIVKAIGNRFRAGRSLNANQVRKEDRSLYNAASRYFECWRLAIKAAGIKDWRNYGYRPRSERQRRS